MAHHHRKLERMYLRAPVQNLYKGIGIEISEGRAIVSLPVSEKFFHAANSIHGSVYFRLLDDAAYFSVNSLVEDVFMLTASFHIDLLRPVNSGKLIAEGHVLSGKKNLFHASSELRDDKGRLVATGKGSFMRSQIKLIEITGYEENKP